MTFRTRNMWLLILGKSDLDSGSYWFPPPLLLDQFPARYISSRHRLACNSHLRVLALKIDRQSAACGDRARLSAKPKEYRPMQLERFRNKTETLGCRGRRQD